MKWPFLKIVSSITVFMAVAFCSPLSAHDVELITHPSNPIDTIDVRELRAIFSMRVQTWKNQEPVHVFVLLENDPIHEHFCKESLKVFPHQLQAGWDRLVFSGTGEAPKVVNTETQMLEAIRSTPGSIGYMSTEYKLKQEKAHDVKTLIIQ